MIRDLDARVLADQTLSATLHLEGDQRDVVTRKFRKAGSEAFAGVIISGITGGTETLAIIHEKPAQNGIIDLHELMQDQGAIEPVVQKWGRQIYPAIASRLGLVH